MDGVLVVDKPEGLTSHDVVAVARRALGERRIGHTGTLDPLATGVLPLAIGRATRLVRFLSPSDKDYDAKIRFGLTTDSYDITGTQTSRSDRQPDRTAVLRAIEGLTGDYLQVPPAFSAKKVGGKRAYSLARKARVAGSTERRQGVPVDGATAHEPAIELPPVRVQLSRAELLSFDGTSAQVALTCSSGFYVRSFAHALGERVGTGGCLEALRRTRSGEFSLESAIALDQLQRGESVALERLTPLEQLLTRFPAVRLTSEGRQRVSHGQQVTALHVTDGMSTVLSTQRWARLIDMEGRLVAIGTAGPEPSSLHPAVVLI